MWGVERAMPCTLSPTLHRALPLLARRTTACHVWNCGMSPLGSWTDGAASPQEKRHLVRRETPRFVRRDAGKKDCVLLRKHRVSPSKVFYFGKHGVSPMAFNTGGTLRWSRESDPPPLPPSLHPSLTA
eukprot:CAMPEP_0181298748 /NCGR_PEP_ID=MMETSP1101-20121128/5952_1 /TAXON_ID=46948 /ORGANISM="Rhodomonas abbreviata, Strain Caron Lab Isolate" /LENGTH=127 /DNA_ID=CAMNT_0023403799 /DNA_START=169 /DNA_END=552 /DNA_ORIENTATION=-